MRRVGIPRTCVRASSGSPLPSCWGSVLALALALELRKKEKGRSVVALFWWFPFLWDLRLVWGSVLAHG